MRLERDIESKVGGALLRWAAKNSARILYLKLNVSNVAGIPDRLVLSDDRVLFVEFKRPGMKPTKIQEYMHERLRRMGFPVMVKTDDGIDDILGALK